MGSANGCDKLVWVYKLKGPQEAQYQGNFGLCHTIKLVCHMVDKLNGLAYSHYFVC
jgi:hypothetical protein